MIYFSRIISDYPSRSYKSWGFHQADIKTLPSYQFSLPSHCLDCQFRSISAEWMETNIDPPPQSSPPPKKKDFKSFGRVRQSCQKQIIDPETHPGAILWLFTPPPSLQREHKSGFYFHSCTLGNLLARTHPRHKTLETRFSQW